jgi:hypothetical protein
MVWGLGFRVWDGLGFGMVRGILGFRGLDGFRMV